jgi:phosphoribosylformimino-5-aminoimidazole carboxamide ribotide isomerase
VAQRWEAEGAAWLHLVDLDGAMSEASQNREIAKRIFKMLRIPVQFGGGLRTQHDLEDVLGAGASRAVIGTAAVQNPDFLTKALQRFGERVVVGIDARDGCVATHGWNQVGSLEAVAFAQLVARSGVQRVVYTDIAKDGMLAGPNLQASKRLAIESRLKVIASGGVASLDDLRALSSLESIGIEGAIVGKALYERRFTLKQAIEAGGGAVRERSNDE